jgi:hypothetical protein
VKAAFAFIFDEHYDDFWTVDFWIVGFRIIHLDGVSRSSTRKLVNVLLYHLVWSVPKLA